MSKANKQYYADGTQRADLIEAYERMRDAVDSNYCCTHTNSMPTCQGYPNACRSCPFVRLKPDSSEIAEEIADVEN